MRTVDLAVNWRLYGVFLVLSLGLFTLSSIPVAGTITLSVLCYGLLGASLVSLILALSDKRFVHIDKAGVSYSFGFGTHYIHSEDIISIKRKRAYLLTVVQIQIKAGVMKSFYCWDLSDSDFSRAEQLLASK
ncbi:MULTISPECIES: hypothetical protein [Pseudoalteromonas]|uniref:Uncharacterized protein n=1 Tax=Pseudoalteromonas amylolytica TaxID=1859457 RepID=A0A1S1MW80_9GAMM|nr:MULTISPECIES: hypothetical protein [Pseudoalteromonas]OHU91811.1 hypothetical protein BFC16_02290 [Pseudoalteromonas sp. JW3]OHU93137.1 hypothetical protein BET10_02200 [Pseudoalteromonas amylolytica]